MPVTPSLAPPVSPVLLGRLSLMMFLQYAIWGAWLPLLWPFLHHHRGFDGGQVGDMFAVGAIGALLAPFLAGQIADRWFPTEKYLAISHVLGGLLIWQLASIETYAGFLVFSLLYSLIYAPTLSLTNSLSFHHLPDRDRDFGRVRLWGTVGWIVVGIGIGQWLMYYHTPERAEASRTVIEERLLDSSERQRLLSESIVTLHDPPMRLNVREYELDEERGELVVEIVEGGPEGPTTRSDSIPLRNVRSLVSAVDEISWAGRSAQVREALEALEAAGDDLEEVNRIIAELAEADALDPETLTPVIRAVQRAGMADAFRLSGLLGILMGLYCFTLPRTPPATGERKSAPAKALLEIRRQPLITLFLLAVPISCIHQFYFVHTAEFLGEFQTRADEYINRIFGVGGAGMMTLGQMSEIVVLAMIPLIAPRVSRKALLTVGVVAYALRMFLFAYVESIERTTGIPAVTILMSGVALHGLVFGCFIFVAFMIVDEETTGDVRASAQSFFNMVIVGVGIIVGSKIAGRVAEWSKMLDPATGREVTDWTLLFGVPMWAALACLVILLVFYPGGRRKAVAP